MKDIKEKLIQLLKEGYCTPQIARIAKKIKEPSTTIHYNIKKLEKDGIIKTHKSVFNYKKIDQGYCTFLLVLLKQEKYAEPEEIAKEIAKNPSVESIDIITGDYNLLIKIRFKDVDEYYDWIRLAIKKYHFEKAVSMSSLKQIKTEFVEL